jgi:predicted RNA-binding protein with PUA-like domain
MCDDLEHRAKKWEPVFRRSDAATKQPASRTNASRSHPDMAKWLMKSEPDVYSWDDLVRDKATDWDGVRNNAARLHLRAMKTGDEAFFYHSGDVRAVVGIMRIAGAGKPDGEDGAWVKVPVEPVRELEPVRLKDIKAEPSLEKMELVRQSRLSVSPVRDEEWAKILKMAG